MTMYLPQTLMELVRRGSNVRIEGATYLPQTLFEIARVAKQTGAHLTIEGSYLPQTLSELANILGNNLTVVVSRDK